MTAHLVSEDKAVIKLPDGFEATWNHGHLVLVFRETGRLYDAEEIVGDTLDLGECPSPDCAKGLVWKIDPKDYERYLDKCSDCTEGRQTRRVLSAELKQGKDFLGISKELGPDFDNDSWLVLAHLEPQGLT